MSILSGPGTVPHFYVLRAYMTFDFNITEPVSDHTFLLSCILLSSIARIIANYQILLKPLDANETWTITKQDEEILEIWVRKVLWRSKDGR